MSRIGKLPVVIPAGVTVDVSDTTVQVKGPRGTLSEALVDRVTVTIEDSAVIVTRRDDAKQSRSNHGLMRALIHSMVVGVTAGFKKELQVVGVGYRADVKGPNLVLALGYSHSIEFPVPDGIAIEVDRNNKITIQGNSKRDVGQVAATLRDMRRPDHYKGKGVRYVGEHVRIKAGKSA